ncbi:cytochrome b561 and DOMON domain-containing protein At5g47530-like [Gastrolobium bilobum]|uniref:cytochrome b561 and DOMON domain-containing protein At5g47530-like n=1 Tax=Gastrolobium bilobum TaxID=150636 RepID=UPI002AB20DA2|nr:cytochrome b561 and DOMON domain-containing protein At5g47530-like [Gastrolobium bilobum]
MASMLRLVLALSVLISVLVTSSAQTCKTQTFSNNKVFTTCRDLPQLTSYLHWSYDEATGKLDIAFIHGGITSTNRWVAWAINPKNNIGTAMPGAQALVAIPQSSGSPKAYTSSIVDTSTQLKEGTISYPVSGLTSTYQNNEVTIFATLTLPNGTKSLVHVWQDGTLSGSNPQEHMHDTSHTNCKETLDLVSGASQAASGNSRQKRRNTHGVLNAISWGILMPTGAVIARYLKVFKSADPAWFYLHITCQASAYIVGIAGFGTGIKLGNESEGVEFSTHKALAIVLIVFGTLQVFALFLRPNKDHKYRFYWNVYHHLIGYATIIISIVNVFQGFEAMGSFVGDLYKNWKHAYIGIIGALGGIAVVLEAYTWIIVLNRRRSEKEMSHNTNGANGVNGYGSRPQVV